MGTESYDYLMDSPETVGCGCALCQDSKPNLVDDSQDDSTFSGSGGTGSTNAPSSEADPETFADYLINGYWADRGGSSFSWAQNNITFSISNEFTASQQDGLRMAFDLWDDVADITFTEVASGADISVVEGDDSRAYASTSYVAGNATNSTISIDTNISSWSNFSDLGNYALMTALHEIGHALGLGHTGNYNGSASYNNDAQWTNDTHQSTVMSYFNASNIGSDHRDSSNAYQYAATPMLIDIVAIQTIYGTNYSTRNGNTIYGFNSNADHDQYDFSISEVPIAIWDGGGTDTIDLSGYSTDSTLYLTEGDFSDVGYMTGNLVIAYGAVIENAIGGTGNDSIYGNDVNNSILGGAGTDTLYGSLGDDTLNGNGGNDTVSYNYNANEFAFNFIDNTTLALTHLTEFFTDSVYNIENFIFSGTTYTFAELESAFGDLQTIALRLFWGGGDYAYNSDDTETTTFSANDLVYAGSTGNQITIDRDFYDTTITVLDSNAPNVVRLYGSDFGDTITINGNHSGLTAQLYSGAGNDVITVQVIGNDRIDAGAGNDIVHAGAGFDKVYGFDGDDIINGEGDNDYLFGMEGNDTIDGGEGNDVVDGGNGIDILNGGNGHDRLAGGAGNDTLNGGAGNDRLDADAGDDILNGGIGFDKLFGYDGNDTLNGGDNNDRLYGMNDDDVLNGDAGHDVLIGGSGNDQLNGGSGNDRLEGEDGNDILNGGDGNDKLYGQNGIDQLSGGNGQDYLYGGLGADSLNGDAHNDYLYGQDGNDILNGGSGHDTLEGGNDDDILNGNDGIDLLEGNEGADTLNGGNDDDTLYGQNGTDRLNGDAGNDTLYGGNHNDILVGGDGTDILFGQGGADTFGFINIDGQIDQIRDFTLGGVQGDLINITNILTGFNEGIDDISDFVSVNFKNSDRTDLFVNTDGAGNDWQQVAIIRGADFTGTTAQDLLDSNTLITDETLV